MYVKTADVESYSRHVESMGVTELPTQLWFTFSGNIVIIAKVTCTVITFIVHFKL